MDLAATPFSGGSSGEIWTEEQHASFLSWMEESFVRRILRPTGAGYRRRITRHPEARLDRHVPDSATESSASPAAGRKEGTVDSENENWGATNRQRKRIRYGAPADQVVPELGSKDMSGK